MEKIFVSNITIDKVRHLKNIEIPLSQQEIKHLLLTGKNGSGKTSLLDAMADYLNSITGSNDLSDMLEEILSDSDRVLPYMKLEDTNYLPETTKKRLLSYARAIKSMRGGVVLKLNCMSQHLVQLFNRGKFIVAYYRANRIFDAQIPKHVEKVELKDNYAILEKPREYFVKYLLDLKATQVFASAGGQKDKAEEIKSWFNKFDTLLKRVFDDDSVHLVFDEDTFKFHIYMDGRELFDFNTLSSGYAAVLDIIADLIMRMEKQTNRKFDFSIPGIVLIDEIETHLHLDMQKHILSLLTTVFPNIQFIVSTHSPFVLNSLDNAVIYDLENKILVEDGLSNIPYGGIVEGYFNADSLSAQLREKYERYKVLVNKQELTDDDFEEVADLEMYLNEIPDYLALNLTTEYQRLKAYLRNRSDI